MGRAGVQAHGRPSLTIFPHCAPGDMIQPAWLINPKTCESDVHTVRQIRTQSAYEGAFRGSPDAPTFAGYRSGTTTSPWIGCGRQCMSPINVQTTTNKSLKISFGRKA